MIADIQLIDKAPKKETIVYLVKSIDLISSCDLDKKEIKYIKDKVKNEDKQHFVFNRLSHYLIIILIDKEKLLYKLLEKVRKEGDNTTTFLNRNKQKSITIKEIETGSNVLTAFIEGMILGNYNFIRYKSKKKPNSLNSLHVVSKSINEKDLNELRALVEGVYLCRDMINTPVQEMQAIDFADKIKDTCRPLGIKTDIFKKSKIASLKMAGLLAVNKGSTHEPAFIQLEWKPENISNKKPLVLVGKGIMFDTGGLSLKPPSAMEEMKSDMSGGAAVFGVMYAIAKTKLPVHVIALIPATDNQPGNNAMAPGDIITMSNNVTVEILNTDAEGRLVLADALCYASRFKPSLVIDIATLTGSAERALGKYGMVAVESEAEMQLKILQKTGMEVYERIAPFPFWDEYDKEIESDIADIRNIGKNNNAGAITAGKFLARFVDYPWIHLDIAGMAFMAQKESYINKGASGVGVRLLYKYVKNMQAREI